MRRCEKSWRESKQTCPEYRVDPYDVPTVVGRKGVYDQVEIELWPKEKLGLQNSAKALKETLAKVKI